MKVITLSLLFSVSFLFCLLSLLKHIQKKTHILNWQRSLNLPQHRIAFQKIYKDVDGFALSHQARLRGDAFEYVYGEIEFTSFIAVLSLVEVNSQTVFYDLGSGTGKAVLAAAMVYPIKKSVGVELLPELHCSACDSKQLLAAHQDYAAKAQKIEFVLDNFLQANILDATMIFINATSFVGLIWDELVLRLELLPNLKVVITTTKKLHSASFVIVKKTKIQMSWGVVDAFIHARS